jgi:hypothetical protein
MLSDYILFIDESGDHGLASIDPNYPVFVLCGALIHKGDYAGRIIPAFTALKLEFWGHAEVVLHEMEIRKPRGRFSILQNAAVRMRFLARLSEVMAEVPCTFIFGVIMKEQYAKRWEPRNPYDLSMSFVLERAFLHLNSMGQGDKETHVVVEARGPKEDAELTTTFSEIVAGANACGRPLPFSLVMVPKAANSVGLQVADLVARPVGLRAIRPKQPNRAFDAIRGRIRADPRGKVMGWGVKRFP